MVRQLNAIDCSTGMIFTADAHAAAQAAMQQEEDAGAKTDQYTDEKIGEHNGDYGGDEGQELRSAITPHLSEELRARELEARHYQDGGERREWNPIDHRGQKEHTPGEQDSVGNCGKPGPRAGGSVYRTTHDHRGDRHGSDESGQQIACALREQFTIGRGDAPLRIQLVGGLKVKKCL